MSVYTLTRLAAAGWLTTEGTSAMQLHSSHPGRTSLRSRAKDPCALSKMTAVRSLQIVTTARRGPRGREACRVTGTSMLLVSCPARHLPGHTARLPHFQSQSMQQPMQSSYAAETSA